MNLNETQREWAAFGGLVAVLAVVVLGMALLAPGVFARVSAAFFAEAEGTAAVVAPATPLPITVAPSVTPTVSPTLPATLPPDIQSATAVPMLRYVVQAGDTLSAIAARHATSVALLVEINQLTNPDRLQPGTAILIPQPAP